MSSRKRVRRRTDAAIRKPFGGWLIDQEDRGIDSPFCSRGQFLLKIEMFWMAGRKTGTLIPWARTENFETSGRCKAGNI